MTTNQLSNFTLNQLESGMQLVHSGNQVYQVTDALAEQFKPGDHLVFVRGFSEPIIIPSESMALVEQEVNAAVDGFYSLNSVADSAIDAFYDACADRLNTPSIWETIQTINHQDVAQATAKGRSTTRLVADDTCKTQMIDGLLDVKRQNTPRVSAIQSVTHDGWSVDVLKSPLGVVGFVFEGRPNVVVDATSVLKSGNAVVFRVGGDAVNTARALMDHVLLPALDWVGISRNAIRFIDSTAHSAAWALFSNQKINLAVARGSGHAVRMLGGIAQQFGIPVSLHGTGGAWMVTSKNSNIDRLHAAIVDSLDRKVCNTLNTLCMLKSEFEKQLPVVLNALDSAGDNVGHKVKVHVAVPSMGYFSSEGFSDTIDVVRASGVVQEPQYEPLDLQAIGTEWEWEKTPEITIVVVESIDEAIELFNCYSAQFVASLITQSQLELIDFFNRINAPFVGNGMTRWVDGQYALNAPELGLSNWENGRFLARSAILSGDSVYTTRLKMNQVVVGLQR
ncbi:MAG: glutamate-5-semialdehyde dehydrogenase [Candidatus Margulisbacteria bacterium]|nr:glutamate-5-semialdehyde dehydrogenase [Candidatus Margulisiibacteriota bacterium]